MSLIEPADVYVTNYETASLLESSLRSLLDRLRGRVALAVDESFFVKNRNAKRSEAVRRLRNSVDRCWVLCGTPAPNSAADVIHQFDIADGGVTFGDTKLPDNPEELRRRIQQLVELRGVYLRRLKVDVLPNLPGKHFHHVRLPLQPVQRDLYVRGLRQLIDAVDATNDEEFERQTQTFLAQRVSLMQICSNPGRLVPGYNEVPAKLLALDKLLSQLIEEQSEKVVLWSFFRYSLETIFRRYAKYSPVRIDGSIADPKERARSVRSFQEDPAVKLFVGNPAAAGAGITLTRSHYAVYESFSIQAAHYLQSLDRIHRRGQDQTANYYILLCENTVEEDDYTRLLCKEADASSLFHDTTPEPLRRDVFLSQLVASLQRV